MFNILSIPKILKITICTSDTSGQAQCLCVSHLNPTLFYEGMWGEF